ncbi:MAG: acyl-CoA desaturase [Melioribacteraceae bacterium]|nr:acyl-CoA desaturase [Melioribacteraceae bacterium]
MGILIIFLSHWFISLFFQTFFLHRYCSHRMFKMTPFWEKTFYMLTYVSQGSSFLNPRAYAIMHRMHHAFSDTERDPHSPHFFKSVFGLMWKTKDIYLDLINNKIKPGEKFQKNVPQWEKFDKFADKWHSRIIWGAIYTALYAIFATSWWMFLLLPIHFLMGPIHGAIVNWAGHKYGYVNFRDTRDNSKNTLFFDFLTLGELFQNNHHKHPSKVNFAIRKFEIDPAYPIILFLNWIGVIQMPNKIKTIQ